MKETARIGEQPDDEEEDGEETNIYIVSVVQIGVNNYYFRRMGLTR